MAFPPSNMYATTCHPYDHRDQNVVNQACALSILPCTRYAPVRWGGVVIHLDTCHVALYNYRQPVFVFSWSASRSMFDTYHRFQPVVATIFIIVYLIVAFPPTLLLFNSEFESSLLYAQ